MNILLSSCTHWWNAEAHYAAVLCEALQEAGHRAWILTRPGTRHAEELNKRGLPIVTDVPAWESNPLRWRKAIAALRALQARCGIDVVDVFRSREFVPHVLAARGTGIALVRTRGSARPVRGHVINRWLYGRACHGVIASAEVLRTELVSVLELPPERVRTVYFPAEAERAMNDVAELVRDPEARRIAREALFAELGWARERKLMCIVGRVFPEKGHAVLLDALPLLLRRVPDAVLAIADKRYPDEAPYRERLVQQVAAAGLTAQVRWLGYRNDLRRIMACADVGVVPSLSSEMNCRVAVEFFAAGTPVVAFPTGALPEVVQEGVSGLITAERSAESLVGTLALLLRDEDLRGQLAGGARDAALKRFSRSGFLEQTLAVFDAARRRAAAQRA
ncbi:MAG: glycosyltransferase family 4 protein [SAR324 cluster bacterium]